MRPELRAGLTFEADPKSDNAPSMVEIASRMVFAAAMSLVMPMLYSRSAIVSCSASETDMSRNQTTSRRGGHAANKVQTNGSTANAVGLDLLRLWVCRHAAANRKALVVENQNSAAHKFSAINGGGVMSND